MVFGTVGKEVQGTVAVAPEAVHSTLADHVIVDGFHITVDLQKSHDVWMVDAATGKEYLDCYSYFASLALGHNHPKMFEPDFLEKLQTAAVANPTNSDVYCTLYAEFVDRFAALAVPPVFKHLFFIAGGAPAVENALKCAFDWKVRKNLAAGRGERGKKVIYFDEAFHGRTGYALSCTHTSGVKIDYYPRLDWPMAPNPKLRFPVTAEVLEEVSERESEALEAIEKAIATGGGDIAAIIIEPIQGEGGDNHFRKEFFQALRKVADENDIMLIFDEVQTGCGATGRMWACEHFGVWPDILVFGKKTQVCGMMVSERVDEVSENVFTVSGRINSTWGGNLVDMVRGIRVIETIKEEGLIERADEVGKYFVEKLSGLAEGSGGLMSNVRGRGMFIAFDLPDGATRDSLLGALLDSGVLALASGAVGVRFRPALVFGKEHVDVVADAVKAWLGSRPAVR